MLRRHTGMIFNGFLLFAFALPIALQVANCLITLMLPDIKWTFLVSGRGLACQQGISLVLAKTPPIHY